jgi:hypothetical protein
MPAPEDISLREAFEHGLFYYLEVLRIVPRAAEEQATALGDFNAPFEIQMTLQEKGRYIIRAPASYLKPGAASAVEKLALLADALPVEALNFTDSFPRSHEQCVQILTHPAWEPLRIAASSALDALKDEAALNTAYFKDGS